MTISEYIKKFNIDFDYFNKTYENLPIKILKYLKSIDKGTFIEIGAHNGIFQSNTKILEDCGWNGLLVEPSPSLYRECKKNRSCNIENFALVSKNYSGTTIVSDNEGISIKNKSGILSMGPESKNVCKAISFHELNKKYGYKKIDFMSLDVEGFELDVLDGIDFIDVDITYLLIEINYNFYSLEDVVNKLSHFGYNSPINISNFSLENCPTWPGTHQDFLFVKK